MEFIQAEADLQDGEAVTRNSANKNTSHENSEFMQFCTMQNTETI